MARMLGALWGLLGLRRRRPPQLTREQALSARPVRNPTLQWRLNEDGEAVITLPRRRDLVGRFLAWMFQVPESRPVLLDEVGTFVWQRVDGTRTVAELVDLLAKEYVLGKREVELSLTEYLKTMAKRGMVGFLISRELAEELGQEGREVLGLEKLETTEDLSTAHGKTRTAEAPDQNNGLKDTGRDRAAKRQRPPRPAKH